MSRENVETVRAMNEAYLRGDVEAALEVLDPKIEWRGTHGPSPTTSRHRRP
jgi:ketosteroid isomerase-like protein